LTVKKYTFSFNYFKLYISITLSLL